MTVGLSFYRITLKSGEIECHSYVVEWALSQHVGGTPQGAGVSTKRRKGRKTVGV